MAQKDIDAMQYEIDTLKEDLTKYKDVEGMWILTKSELDKTKQILHSGVYKIRNIFPKY